METEQSVIEYLAPDDTPEDEVVSIAPLQFPGHLEQLKNLFDRMADIRSKVTLWEKKTVIKDSKSRDEAIRLRTLVTGTAKAIEETYLKITAPLREGIKEARSYATDAQVALIGTKDDPRLGVAGRLTAKVSDYAVKCKAEEEAMKTKALAEQRRINDEIEAWQMEAKWKEERLQLEEDLRLEHLREQALQKAKEEGHGDREVQTDDLAADLEMEEAQAKIDADRAKRAEETQKQEIENQKVIDATQQRTVNTLAVATSHGKVKGVKKVWSIELISEKLLDKKYMVFDPSKARKMLEADMYDKDEKDPEKIIPGLRCVVVLGKGGK